MVDHSRSDMVEPPQHLTKTELALQALRERIRSGELAPGERLLVDELTKELGMSRTPIREALRLLQADRLVTYRPHHGIVVAEVSPDEIVEICRLRRLLEPLAVELAVPQLGAEDLARLEELHGEIVEAARAGHGRSVSDLNADWHWTIYEASGSTMLEDFIRRLWESFPWRTMWVLPNRMERSLDEHEAIMQAIRDGDGTLAAREMHDHVESGEKTALEQLRRELAAQ